ISPGATMRTSKSIADDFLKRKARADAEALKEGEAEKAEAEKAEAEKADELIKVVIAEKLKEVEAEKEAEKSNDFEVHTTKPMSGLEVHTVEPVIPIEEEPVREEPVREEPVREEPVREKSVDRPAVVKKVRVQAKPVVENPGKPVVKKRWYDRIRPFGFEDSE
ncbi:unnamed protein product, partial [marine sediment metagenome]